jgi:hypothetical protein
MNIDEINVDEQVKRVSEAVTEGRYRKATERESMIVRRMQEKVENEKELVGVPTLKRCQSPFF